MSSFLMKAKVYKKQFVGGWWLSEKLDGMRAFWDGGVARGMMKSEVKWANCNKDARYTTPPIATGLWSSLANVIHAPDWWLDTLPPYPLDGELYIPGAKRQELMSVVKRLEPDARWKDVEYWVFDSPPLSAVTGLDDPRRLTPYTYLKELIPWIKSGRMTRVVEQTPLPWDMSDATRIISSMLDRVVAKGGEGVMLRNPTAPWVPRRTDNILKLKHYFDAEGRVSGFIAGQGKWQGYIGSVVVDGRIRVDGFNTVERRFATEEATKWAHENPGCECPLWVEALEFKRGDVLTYKYRTLTASGQPEEADYWRKR